MITIVDYGVGNLFSLMSSLKALGLACQLTGDAGELSKADKIILPGVGAFEDAMGKLRERGLAGPLARAVESGTPLLGICLGMQLLFEESHEFGRHKGLGFIKGVVASLADGLREAGFDYKIPHMGWNPIRFAQPASPLLQNTREGESFYYVHSFYARDCAKNIVATSEYGIDVPGVVQNGRVYGTQFHPEKSGECGLRMLKAFAEVG